MDTLSPVVFPSGHDKTPMAGHEISDALESQAWAFVYSNHTTKYYDGAQSI